MNFTASALLSIYIYFLSGLIEYICLFFDYFLPPVLRQLPLLINLISICISLANCDRLLGFPDCTTR